MMQQEKPLINYQDIADLVFLVVLLFKKLEKEEMKQKIDFPRPKTSKTFDYSFSGLKTAAIYYLQGLSDDQPISKKDFAASYQEAIVDSLMSIFEKAVKETNVPTISGGGGVMANSRLKRKIDDFC